MSKGIRKQKANEIIIEIPRIAFMETKPIPQLLIQIKMKNRSTAFFEIKEANIKLYKSNHQSIIGTAIAKPGDMQHTMENLPSKKKSLDWHYIGIGITLTKEILAEIKNEQEFEIGGYLQFNSKYGPIIKQIIHPDTLYYPVRPQHGFKTRVEQYLGGYDA